ncbi:glycosyltransferase family 4 protein [Oleiharenicola lentus]|uniref:glycosyltransferase family 4 protein n=1 Tax=Oleiharenicola lentus TaxID=2508720 RepID=UPI003F66F607
MKLLVLAQTPPPVHGQSVMVQALVEGLPAHGIDVHHVNLNLSRDSADIGRWRAGKFFSVLGACLRTIFGRFAHGCDTLYYVPAPAKRGALYRDWAVMFFCRLFFKRVVLHWHATGLGDWLEHEAKPLERGLTQFLLGRVSLALVLAESLRRDAGILKPHKIAVVANGVPAPIAFSPSVKLAAPMQVLFLGLGSEEKGLFAALRAVVAANRSLAAIGQRPAFTLVAAGPFPDHATELRFFALAQEHSAFIRHVGIVQGVAKEKLFAESHCLCLPSRYPAEGQPLVILEALARDLPVVASRWRGIPEALPAEALLVEPGNDDALLSALLQLHAHPPRAGAFREHFLAHFTLDRHLAALAAALKSL